MDITGEGNVEIIDCYNDDDFHGKCFAELVSYKTDDADYSYNYASCYAPCEAGDKDISVCGYGYYNEDTLDSYSCINTSKGNLWMMMNYDFCGTSCANDTCEINKPCGSVDEFGTCSSNNAVFCDYDTDEENEVLHIVTCGSLVCDDSDYADCYDPSDLEE